MSLCCGNENFLWTSSLKCKLIYNKYLKNLLKIMFLVNLNLNLMCAKGKFASNAF